MCIFTSDRLWATILHHWPERGERIARYEERFGVSIARSGETVRQRAARSEPLEIADLNALAHADCEYYELPIFTPDDATWQMPPGAFSREAAGAS